MDAFGGEHSKSQINSGKKAVLKWDEEADVLVLGYGYSGAKIRLLNCFGRD